MRYRKLGRSGLLVSELCLGTNMFGGGGLDFWKDLGGLDQKAVNAVVASAIEGGINFIDTADCYSNGESEMRLGQALKDLKLDRSSVVICSKGGIPVGLGPNGGGGSRAHLIDACEKSLKRLGSDHIDLYLLHVFDPVTPIEETLRAFDDLIHAGKVRYVGCSNFAAWEIMKANGIAERFGLARFDVVENNWSIVARDIERDIVPFARAEEVGIMAWGALFNGVLSGKYRRDGSSDRPGRFGGRIPQGFDAGKVHDIVDVLRAVATHHHVTPAEIALAFLLQEKSATSVIFGATSPEQVATNVRASGLVFSEAEMKRLNEVSALPFSFVASSFDGMRAMRRQYL